MFRPSDWPHRKRCLLHLSGMFFVPQFYPMKVWGLKYCTSNKVLSSERTVCRCLSSLTFERIPWKDGSLPSCMNCGCVIYYSDLLLIQKADTVLSCGGQTVMSAPDIIFTRTLQQVAVRGAWTRSSMLEDHLLNYRVTLTPRWGMIYKRHYTLSVHNSNKNPGHSRMITIISVIRLFRERERSALTVLSISPRWLVVVNDSQYLG